MLAARSGHVAACQMLVEKGRANVNITGKRRRNRKTEQTKEKKRRESKQQTNNRYRSVVLSFIGQGGMTVKRMLFQ